MMGHPKHVNNLKALDTGVDIICAQAGKGGGHTGDIATSILIPSVMDAVKGHTSPLTGQLIWVIGAGAVYDGRGLALNLVYGMQAIWVSRRFITLVEAGASKAHKDALLSVDHGDIVHTLIYTGRLLHVHQTPYVNDWETNHQAEIKELMSKGIILNQLHEVEKHPKKSVLVVTFLLGNVIAVINDILPMQTIVDNMVNKAARILQDKSKLVNIKARL